MSAREFKPGDVGTSQFGRVFNTDRGWVFDDNSGYTPADEIRGFRPLVVIDPEDREQVERLWDSIMGRTGITDMQGALREFADPKPRIEEPTGLGAVVEDADGQKWVRTDVDGPAWSEWGRALGRWHFSKINAVRVLSPGWSE